MIPTDALRRHLVAENGTGGANAPTVNDEEILNVLRGELEKDNGEEELTTSEIAEQLPIGSKQTHNRLTALKKDNRVEKRRAGRTDMWSLGPGEPEAVTNPELGPVIRRSSQARRKSTGIINVGTYLGATGFALLIVGMTIWMSGITYPLISVAGFLGFGYSFGVVGAFIAMAGTVLRLAGIAAPRVAEQILLE